PSNTQSLKHVGPVRMKPCDPCCSRRFKVERSRLRAARGCLRWFPGGRPKMDSSLKTILIGIDGLLKAGRQRWWSKRRAYAIYRADLCCALVTIDFFRDLRKWLKPFAKRATVTRNSSFKLSIFWP